MGLISNVTDFLMPKRAAQRKRRMRLAESAKTSAYKPSDENDLPDFFDFDARHSGTNVVPLSDGIGMVVT